MNPATLIQKVRRTIQDDRMIHPGDRVVVAVSGGPDSVALLHILHTLAGDLGFQLHVAHFNHELRGPESAEDAALVTRLAASLGLPVTSGSAGADLAKRPRDVSIEDAARQIRYAFLEETATLVGARRIATGHTADDQAETVLMRLIQGAGPGGLGGIRPVRGERIIRPLIRCRSEEILAYLEASGVSAREDSSNRDTTFLRNRIRLRLLPLLQEEFNPGMVDALGRTASLEREADRYLRGVADTALEELAGRRKPGEIRLALGRLADYDVVLQRYILRAALEAVLGDLTDVSYKHIQAVLDLVQRGETPFRQVALPGSIVAYPEHGSLVFSREGASGDPGPQEIAVPGITEVPDFGLEIRTSLMPAAKAEGLKAETRDEALFDRDTLHPPLRVRAWRRGDRFQPSGMRGRKKLQDFFIDEKVPKSTRMRIPLLVDREAIHWIVGYRTSERSRVREGTRQVLLVKASPLTG